MSNYVVTLAESGESTITATSDGQIHQVTNEHPNFAKVLQAVVRNAPFEEFLNLLAGVEIDPRVEVRHGIVYFGNEPIHNFLTDTILRYNAQGRDTQGLVRFLERLQANPSKRSRDQLFSWTQAKELTIDSEGYFIAFKSVFAAGEVEDGDSRYKGQNLYHSCSAGRASVNGNVQDGYIHQSIGDVVTMPREAVQDDPTIGCHTGLHAGTFNYAQTFSGDTVLEVRIDPADVVSVPTDCGFAKLRTCRYEVVTVHEMEKRGDLSDYEPESYYWDDEEEDDADAFIEAAFTDIFTDAPKTLVQRLRARLSGRSHEEEDF